MIFLNVADTRQSLLPEAIANLPALVQLIGSAATRGMPGALMRGNPQRIPGDPGFGLNVDPDTIPEPDELRPFLFPSMLALEVDEQGFQFVARGILSQLQPRGAGSLGGGPAAAGGPVGAVRGPTIAVGQQPQADRPCNAQLRVGEQPPAAPSHQRPERQAVVKLASGDPSLPRAAGVVQRVQARRALGQSA